MSRFVSLAISARRKASVQGWAKPPRMKAQSFAAGSGAGGTQRGIDRRRGIQGGVAPRRERRGAGVPRYVRGLAGEDVLHCAPP